MAAGINIEIERCKLPETTNGIIIEINGGLFTPLGKGITNVDLIKNLGCPVVIVTLVYLGSINHTLLTIHALRTFNIPITGIIFNGKEVVTTRRFVTQHSGVPKLVAIPHLIDVNITSLIMQADCISRLLKRRLKILV